jgi:hypothetical protein
MASSFCFPHRGPNLSSGSPTLLHCPCNHRPTNRKLRRSMPSSRNYANFQNNGSVTRRGCSREFRAPGVATASTHKNIHGLYSTTRPKVVRIRFSPEDSSPSYAEMLQVPPTPRMRPLHLEMSRVRARNTDRIVPTLIQRPIQFF